MLGKSAKANSYICLDFYVLSLSVSFKNGNNLIFVFV